MLRVAIVEDQAESADRLRRYVHRFCEENGETLEAGAFGDAETFLAGYRPVYDVVFMDIELPGMDGMEAARRLREMDGRVLLIFVTNLARYAVKGYEVGAMDYIVKPLRYAAFEPKLRRAAHALRQAEEALLVTQPSGARRLLLREIEYIDVRGHCLTFHTQGGEVTGSGTLEKTQEKLSGKGFLRCSKCYLVNVRHIDAVEGLTLKMAGGDELQISRPRKKTFMSELAACMGNENVL